MKLIDDIERVGRKIAVPETGKGEHVEYDTTATYIVSLEGIYTCFLDASGDTGKGLTKSEARRAAMKKIKEAH
jgi:hypothetical protein